MPLDPALSHGFKSRSHPGLHSSQGSTGGGTVPRLTPGAAGRPQFLHDCQPKTVIPCYMHLSIGQLTKCQAGSVRMNKEERVPKTEAPSFCTLVSGHPITSATFSSLEAITKSSPIQEGNYTRAWKPGGRDRWRPLEATGHSYLGEFFSHHPLQCGYVIRLKYT